MIKLVVVGDSGPLKTRLLITYTTNKFPSEYTPTVSDNYAVNIMIDKEDWTLACWDTAGQEDYDRLRPLSYPQTDIFLIYVNIARVEGYESAKNKWTPELSRHVPNIPKILVGIKDFEESTTDQTKYGTKIAKEIGAEKYLECDLMTGKGVKDVFDEAIVAALARVLTEEELRKGKEKEKEKEKKHRKQAAARKTMEAIKEDP